MCSNLGPKLGSVPWFGVLFQECSVLSDKYVWKNPDGSCHSFLQIYDVLHHAEGAKNGLNPTLGLTSF